MLSGVNDGPNVGEDVTYSGTIAAAMEATLCSARRRWRSARPTGTAASIIGRLQSNGPGVSCAMLIEHGWPKRVLINVNFPDLPTDKVRGIRVVRQGLHETRRHPGGADRPARGRPYYWIGAQLPDCRSAGQRGTDMGALDEGYVSVTPLHMDLTHRRTLAWLREVIE